MYICTFLTSAQISCLGSSTIERLTSTTASSLVTLTG